MFGDLHPSRLHKDVALINHGPQKHSREASGMYWSENGALTCQSFQEGQDRCTLDRRKLKDAAIRLLDIKTGRQGLLLSAPHESIAIFLQCLHSCLEHAYKRHTPCMARAPARVPAGSVRA